MAKLYVFLAATTFLMLIAVGAAIAGTSATPSPARRIATACTASAEPTLYAAWAATTY